jgi:uncharacterized membrane protein YcaP (DUF421 family)
VDAVLRAIFVFFFLMIVFRITGRRTLSHLTTFDFVLLLVIGESTQQALIGDDFSIIRSVILIVTLLFLNVSFALLKVRWKWFEHLTSGTPTVLVEKGELNYDEMKKARIDEDDILSSARESQGLERLEQIKYAVLETQGRISIIPMQRK